MKKQLGIFRLTEDYLKSREFEAETTLKNSKEIKNYEQNN
jgi:hypothetical protein